MNIFREGRLVDSRLGTGHILSLELDSTDMHPLLTRGYTMNRLMGLKRGMQTRGWQAEDKVHIYLKEPPIPEDETHACRLSLDPGGDLYYTIMKGHALDAAPSCTELELPNEAVDDRYSRLERVGVKAVRFYYLDTLARAIRNPSDWIDSSLTNTRGFPSA